MREKFNNLSTRNKVLCIAIPVIVIALLILLGVGLTNKNTQDTKDVATTQNTSSTDYTLDVESVVKDEADAVEETTKVEPEAAVSSAVDSVTSTIEVMSPVEEATEMKTEVESEEVVSEQNVIIENDEAALNSSSDDLYHSWNKKATWTASNGVVIKINDAWADAVLATGDGDLQALWADDPEADWSPNSDFMNAVHEFVYGDPVYKNGMDRYNPEIVNVSDLPQVPTVSTKQSSISVTPEFSAYKEQWDRMLLFQGTGNWEGSTTLCQLQINNDFAGQVASGQGYMWLVEKNSDGGFKISIYRNLSELSWDGLLTVLKLITPDAQAVYNAVYEDVYVGCDIPSYNAWYDIPNTSSQIYVTDTTGLGYMEYFFK